MSDAVAGEGTIELRPADERIPTRMDWLDARGSFPMGPHSPDPSNTHFGLLYVHQEDRIAPHSGFPPHPHREVEVVTWVLGGALEHRDNTGGEGVIKPGTAQHMSAGSGIVHSEMNPFDEQAHVIQMWVAPDESSGDPYYSDAATLWAARLRPGAAVTLPDAPFVHLFCARGRTARPGAAVTSVLTS